MSMLMPEHEHEPMPEYETLPKKPRLEIEEEVGPQAHLEAAEESALKKIIWLTCSRSLQLCKQLSDQLYRSLLDGVARLAYLLFDKEELYEIGKSHMLYDQQNKFWDEFERFAEKEDSCYEVCKWIANTNIDWDGYSLLTEYNLADMLMTYRSVSYKKPFVDYIDRGQEVEKSPIDDDDDDDIVCVVEAEKCPIDDDIEEAIKKAKQYPRLTVDEYTFLLLEIYGNDWSVKCQEFLLAKAVERIDVKALYGLEADAIQKLVELYMHSSAHEELDWLIRLDLMSLVRKKKDTVTDRLTTSSFSFRMLLYNEFERRELAEIRHTSPAPLTVFDLIEIAELRRKAEGSRFINRDHFLWAFDVKGCGLDTALKDELASRMAAEDHPPYHIYDTVIKLARAEYVLPDVDHLAFAVIFGRFRRFGFSGEEVKEMQEDFNHFKTAMRGIVTKPMDLMVSDAHEYLLGDYNIKVFQERLVESNGPWWDPFRD